MAGSDTSPLKVLYSERSSAASHSFYQQQGGTQLLLTGELGLAVAVWLQLPCESGRMTKNITQIQAKQLLSSWSGVVSTFQKLNREAFAKPKIKSLITEPAGRDERWANQSRELMGK